MNPGETLDFPPGFLWGTATSPTQVEGHIENEWTQFTALDGGNCRRACDHYHRYPEDVDWMARLGANAYRFGIEWSRLQSAPFAPLNPNELARYVHLLECLQAKSITPMVVLHHFSNPQWINAWGGWTNPATIPAFVDYVRQLGAALKGKVHLWNTFNEPDTYACMGYLLGGFPPHNKWRLGKFRRVIDHMARAHVKVSRILQQEGGGKIQVGIAKNWTFFHAYKKWLPWDQAMAYACHYTFNKFVLDAFMGVGRRRASTFIGLNYYGRVRFHHFRPMIPASGMSPKTLKKIGFVCDDMVERNPEGLATIVSYLNRKFRLPIYITEHGSASSDEKFRESDLRENLASLHGAIAEAADVRGFFYWSLMDNFEWQFGYAKKFGLLTVDFEDEKLPRSLKPLGDFYSKICRTNTVARP
jgi:beta-glucosidase